MTGMTIDEVTKALTRGCCSRKQAADKQCDLCGPRYEAIDQVIRWHDTLDEATAYAREMSAHALESARKRYEAQVALVNVWGLLTREPMQQPVPLGGGGYAELNVPTIAEASNKAVEVVFRAESAERERDEARAMLAELREASAALVPMAIDPSGDPGKAEEMVKENERVSTGRPGWCWSANGENYFPAASEDAAIAALVAHFEDVALGVADLTGEIGETVWATAEEVIDGAFGHDQILQAIEESAADLGGDFGADYPDLSHGDAEALAADVRAVIARHLARADPPGWFTVVSERRVVVRVGADGKGHVTELEANR